MCRSRRALVRDGADIAKKKNEPSKDYRLRIQKPTAAKDAALHRAVRGAAYARLQPPMAAQDAALHRAVRGAAGGF